MIILSIIYILLPMEAIIDYFYKNLANNEVETYD